jgi:hypothetical protein
MLISLNLPQFLKQRTLFIVTDTENARFYLAHRGEMNELVESAIRPVPEGNKLASGGWKKKTLRKGRLVKSPRGLEGFYLAFVKRVRLESLKLLNLKKAQQIYVFGPHHYLNELLSGLHPYVKAKITRVYSGDYIHDHPIEIIRKAKELPE